jgi:hypothetical protein
MATYLFGSYAAWTPNYWIQTALQNISGTDIAFSISWQQIPLEANASTSLSVLFHSGFYYAVQPTIYVSLPPEVPAAGPFSVQLTVANEVNPSVLKIFLVVDSVVSGSVTCCG